MHSYAPDHQLYKIVFGLVSGSTVNKKTHIVDSTNHFLDISLFWQLISSTAYFVECPLFPTGHAGNPILLYPDNLNLMSFKLQRVTRNNTIEWIIEPFRTSKYIGETCFITQHFKYFDRVCLLKMEIVEKTAISTKHLIISIPYVNT